MAFIRLPNCVKIEIIFRKNNAPVVNIIWGEYDVEPGLEDLEAIAQAVVSWWNTTRKDQVVSSMALEEVRVTDWNEENGLQHVEIVSPASAGTSAGTDLPSNVAAVVSFYTGYSGRSNRGRNYLAGMPESGISANQIGTAYLAAMISDYVTLGSNLLTSGAVRHVVASFYHNNAPRAEGVATVITDYGGDNVVDTQRRRIPRSYS